MWGNTGIGPNLRKYDCYEITLAIFHELLIHAAFGQRKSEKSVNHYILLGMIKKMFCCWRSEMLKIIKKFGLCLSQLKLEFSIFHILWLCENSRLVNGKSTFELDWLRNEVDVPAIVCLGESPLNLAGSGPIIFTSCGTSRPPKQGRSSTSDEKSIYKMSGKNSRVRVHINGPIGPVTCFDPSKWARV